MKRLLLLLGCLLLSSCAEMELASHVTKQALPPSKSEGTFKVGTPYKVEGQRYHPKESYDLVETGIASWYGDDFHGKKTANGETFDMYELTAAHRTLQMPSLVRVTNLENGRSLVVRVNDRGPFKRSRVIDVSKKAAELLGFKMQGTAKVRLEVLPQESLKIAQAARSGTDTRGYEVALNRGGVMPAGGVPPVQPVTRETALARAPMATGLQAVVPGHTRGGAFYPDPIVTEMPVTPTAIYVQAGSFTVADNAQRLAAKLGSLGQARVTPAIVGGRQFYRVRLGPVGSVEQADEILARAVAAGGDKAIIVVE